MQMISINEAFQVQGFSRAITISAIRYPWRVLIHGYIDPDNGGACVTSTAVNSPIKSLGIGPNYFDSSM
jgi:hypothetical protein